MTTDNKIRLLYAMLAAAIMTMLILLLESCTDPHATASQSETFVDSLLQEMTLEEKVGQLHQITSQWEMTGPAPQSDDNDRVLEDLKSGRVGSMLNVIGVEATRNAQQLVVENSRLGIPLLFGYDVIHGYRTMFPIPLGEAASWDPELCKLSAAVAARETAASGVHWTFAPMMDVGRDPRWGRVMEGAGEDPYLTAALSVARVQGFQGDSLSDPYSIAACAKHFAGYALAEGGRDYNTAIVDANMLHNVVLPPFKASSEAGVATFMNSFNYLMGIPATASAYLQRDLLKGEWGYDGFVVSDWNSIGEMIDHGAAADLKHAAELAILAGSDMDMEGKAYRNHLIELVEAGKVSEALIDEAVKRVLTIKYELGLFNDPYKYCDLDREKYEVYNKQHQEAARLVARESMVLLKNKGQLLPLSKDQKKIAVIGPFAADKDVPLGNWRANAMPNSAVSLLEGIKEAVHDSSQVSYAQGVKYTEGDRSFIAEIAINDSDATGLSEAGALAKRSDVVILVLGEDCYQSGEGRSQSSIELKGLQQQLFDEVYQNNQNVVVVLMTGRPVAIPSIGEKSAAILEAWHAGSQAGHAIADVLFGDYNPSGKLPMTFPHSTGQVPLYYNYFNTGRPGPKDLVFWSHYTDETNDPMYPFGFGLSYTQFEYSNLKANVEGDQVNISVQLKNVGAYDGEEVVQLYIRDRVSSVIRPVKELKGFDKVFVEKNSIQTVTFQLPVQDLGVYDAQGKWIVEFGEYDIMVGGSSDNVLSELIKI